MRGGEQRGVRSLTATLAIAFFSLSAAALLFLSGLSFFTNQRIEQEIITSRQKLVAWETAEMVSNFIREKMGTLSTCARITDPSSMTAQQQRDLTKSILGLEPAFRHVILLDSLGSILAQASRRSQVGSRGFKERLTEEVFSLVRSQGTYISPVVMDSETAEPVLAITVRLQDPLGEFQGALAAEMNLKFMWDLVDRLTVKTGGQVYVVDKAGNLLASSDRARVLSGENVRGLLPVSTFMNETPESESSGVKGYPGISGVPVVGMFAPLGTPDWAVVTETSEVKAYRTLISETVISVVLALSMAFCAGVAGVFLARRLTVPVTKLMRTAARITAGETTLQAEVAGPKEIAGLARAFNAMTARLRQTLEGLEQRVSERTAQLKESVDELEAFSYSVSHDLRAPLRAIHGFSKILLEDFAPGLPAQSARYLRLIFENTKQMKDLIDGLLAFSRLGRHILEKKTVAPAKLVRQALEVLAEEQKGRRIDISIGELPPCEGDPMLLQQVWINLISNALKFTRRRATAMIAIGYEQNNDHPAYFVRDNGIGFDMKYAEKLFGVFQRLHKSEEFEGTGVGLATVFRIIRRHGGRIWADAKPDEGAVFYFSL